jgi:hypothetical protein
MIINGSSSFQDQELLERVKSYIVARKGGSFFLLQEFERLKFEFVFLTIKKHFFFLLLLFGFEEYEGECANCNGRFLYHLGTIFHTRGYGRQVKTSVHINGSLLLSCLSIPSPKFKIKIPVKNNYKLEMVTFRQS